MSIYYRHITGPDDASFGKEVSKFLNKGWQLYGNATLTYDADQKRVICGQAIVKEKPDMPYNPDADLSTI